MLKWAVYSKKNQEVQSNNEAEEIKPYAAKPCADRTRRSLDAQTVKRSKKPSRYQRRSLGAAARKNNIRNADKENFNCVGNTPNHFREGFVKKSDIGALKDVSNITPTSVTPILERRKYLFANIKDDLLSELPPTPPTYSRRVREAKKRKLEMSISNTNEVFTRNSCTYKSERRINPDRSISLSSKLSHSVSEPSLHDLTERLSASSNSSKSSTSLSKQPFSKNPISTTETASEGIVEIEYDKDVVINCVEKPVVEDAAVEMTTLPIFGHHVFTEHPFYFKKMGEGPPDIRPLKRTRKKSSDFESSFKSPSIDKKDVHSLIRDGCSPVSITPLSTKLAALRFSAMSTHTKSQRIVNSGDVTEFFPKVDPFILPVKDEESSTEMENKFILAKDSVSNVTESTSSTTQMGDITLEKMIEDIIKSTKIVKSKRRILKNEAKVEEEDEIPTVEAAKDLFVKPCSEIKSNLIKEARCVNLSRENSLSPKSTPVKKRTPIHRVNEKLLKNVPIGGFILDDGDGYNEREVRTPDIDTNNRDFTTLCRSQSMKPSTTVRRNIESTISESTPDLFAATDFNNVRLRRQRCIRRKKSTVSNESIYKLKDLENKSSLVLTLEMGIPSPLTELQDVSLCEPISILLDVPNDANLNLQNVSHSSLKSLQNRRSRELFGLTLDNGIPSPITPVPNLKRPSMNILSDERANKTSKLGEDLLANDITTPVIEHRSSRRCLTYSLEESSINSSEEKRGSVASNRLERSTDRFAAPKGTIDLEIETRNNVIDVHVIRCKDLQRSSGKTDDINAYAKVVISGVTENQPLPSQRSIFQRTSVLYGKREPEFQRHLRLPLPTAVYDHQILHVSVWHRDKKYRRSEFLGCVSFPLKDAIKSDISGTYFLQSSSRQDCARVTKMATDNTDTSTNDGAKDITDKGATSNGPSSQGGQVTAALQREADEHLFLRYLELDPPEDPAAPRRQQRQGRTPFTSTRKLVRGTGGGFGFTVVWTRPPRVERVAAGGSAERAGLRAGDYIVFVGNKNVVTSTEEEVRNLVKSAGQNLNLETFRRVPQNGVGIRTRLAQVTIPSAPDSTPPPPRSPRTAMASPATAARPPTACSSTSQSLDRRKLHLPQVTFSKEVGNGIIV